jgi:hypothetical protein
VLYITGNITPTIEGLRITGGYVNFLNGGPWGGGGICIITATATLSSNEVVDNYAEKSGGGVYLRQSCAVM